MISFGLLDYLKDSHPSEKDMLDALVFYLKDTFKEIEWIRWRPFDAMSPRNERIVFEWAFYGKRDFIHGCVYSSIEELVRAIRNTMEIKDE